MTDSISKGLYIERFKTFNAGVFGEMITCYITDSISFRQKIGSYDEHEFFRAHLDGNKILAYNLESRTISDTIEKKTIFKYNLWKYHHSASNCLQTTPLFGKNTIQCDTDYCPASSYKTDDGLFFSQVQYKCGNNFLNAVYYTDSQNFSVFIGVYEPGSFESNYRVEKIDTDRFDFYNISERFKADTVKVATYLLADIRKGKLNRECE